jgi:hypothetical protein
MKHIAEYIGNALTFERLAETEKDANLRASLLEQAEAGQGAVRKARPNDLTGSPASMPLGRCFHQCDRIRCRVGLGHELGTRRSSRP